MNDDEIPTNYVSFSMPMLLNQLHCPNKSRKKIINHFLIIPLKIWRKTGKQINVPLNIRDNCAVEFKLSFPFPANPFLEDENIQKIQIHESANVHQKKPPFLDSGISMISSILQLNFKKVMSPHKSICEGKNECFFNNSIL